MKHGIFSRVNTTLMLYAISAFVYGGDCICEVNTGSSYRSCQDSPINCRSWCNARYNPSGIPGFVATSYSNNVCAERSIQNCQIKDLRQLGYMQGGKQAFCINNGWTGGVIPNDDAGYCWKANTNAQNDCPRLAAYYQCTGSRCCDHLTPDDASQLHVCGH